MPIFYSALMLTGVNLLLRLAGTSFQVYISGQIGAAGVGLLQLVMSVGGLAMTAGIAGVRTSAMYLTAEELGRKQPQNVTWVLSSCFLYSILCSGVVAASLYGLAPFLAQQWIGDIRTVAAIRLYAGFMPITCLCGVMTGYFTAANRIGTLAGVEVAEQLFSITATILALRFYTGGDPSRACQAVIFGGGIGGCFTLVVLTILRLREHAPTGKPIPIRNRLLSCALPLAGADVAKAGISTTENLMVPKRLALFPGVQNPLAAFGLVCGMVFPVLMFPASILFSLAELLIPELARCAAAGSERRIQYLTRRSLRVGLIYGCSVCCVMYILAHWLCIRLYDSPEAAYWLRRFCLLIPMLYCDALIDAMTKGLGQQRACVRYNIFTSAMDVGLLFFLLPRFGMEGYFFSFTVTHALNFALSLKRLLKIARIRLSFKAPLVCILITGIATASASVVTGPLWAAAAGVTILGCLLFLFRVVHREDLQWLKSLTSKEKSPLTHRGR